MEVPHGKGWPTRQMIVALRPVAVAISLLYGNRLHLPLGAWPLRDAQGNIEAVVFFD